MRILDSNGTGQTRPATADVQIESRFPGGDLLYLESFERHGLHGSESLSSLKHVLHCELYHLSSVYRILCGQSITIEMPMKSFKALYCSDHVTPYPRDVVQNGGLVDSDFRSIISFSGFSI